MTNQEIKTVGQTIAQETQIGGNTAARVGGVIEGIGVALDNKDAADGYYQATINGGSISVNAPNYLLGTGGNLRIKMPSAGTTASTLTIGNANAVQLWYNGAAVSAQNTWEADEIISVFYDGTRFMASNSQGGGGKAEKIKYDNSQSGLASNNVQGALDSLSPLLGTDTTAFSLTGNNNTFVYRTFVLEAGKKYIIKTDMVAADYNSSKIPNTNVYSVTPYINGAYGTPVFSTIKSIDTPPQQYSFVAVEAEYYSVGIRANKNTAVSFWLEEVDLIIDNEPTVGSNGLVRSGGVYDFVSPLNPHSFTVTGADSTIVSETFKLEAGEEYTVEIDMSTFLYSNIAETNIYSVYYYKGAKSFPVFYTMKGTDEVIAKHTFTAVEADYYSVGIRANEGAEVKLYLYKSSGIPVDETPKQHSPNVVRSSGLYKMQMLNRELSIDSFTCEWLGGAYYRYRCAIKVPYIPVYVKVDNKPEGYYVSIQSNQSVADALNPNVNPIQYSAWNELEYTFDDDSAHCICLNIKKVDNSAMTDSDIENFSQMRITLYPWIAASDGGDDIISLNNEAETKYYLESANLQDHGWTPQDGYTTKAKPVVLLHFSDLHGNAENLKRIVEFKNHYSDYINDAIGSGDLVRDTLADDWTFWNAAGAEDILQTTGNHEYYVSAPNYSWATTQQVYNKFFGNINNWGVTGHPSGTCYYYKDYAAQNLRLIVLDSLINDASQNAWVQSLLEDVLNNHPTYHVVFFCHTAPFYKQSLDTSFCTLSNWDSYIAGNQSYAFRVYMNAIAGYVDTFIAEGGKFVGWICGHTHRDFFSKLTDYPNQLFVSVGCATDMSDWTALKNGTDMFRESYTKSMDLFNIVTIDTANSRLKLKRIGADIDRDLRKKVALVYDYENREIIYTE